MNFCEKCGTSIGDRSRYCPQCGCLLEKYEKFSVEEEMGKFCGSCGATVQKSYCGNCGTYAPIISLKEESTVGKNFLNKMQKASGSESKKNSRITLPKISIKWFSLFLVFLMVVGAGVWMYVEKQVLEPKQATQWVHYTEHGKVGFKDKKGKVKLKAEYINVGKFSDNGLTKVVGENHFWGYMNCHGKMVIDAKFEGAADFAENGLARVCVGGKYGYIDRKGKYVIKPQYDDAGDFAENGLACVKGENGKYGYIDEKGKCKIKAVYFEAYGFAKNGLARVRTSYYEQSGYGFIDQDGEYVIGEKYEVAGDFADNGLACVALTEDDKMGYIDKNDNYVIKAKYENAGDFTENGLAPVAIEHEPSGEKVRPDDYWDYKEDYYDDDEYEYYDSYEEYYEDCYGDPWVYEELDSEGNYDAYEYDYGFINEKGEYVIEPKYCDYEPFKENGLARVEIYGGRNKLCGWIDEKGKVIIKPQYDGYSGSAFSVSTFSANGLACVKDPDSGLFGYINEKGKFEIEPTYTWASWFAENGLARVCDGEDKSGYIDFSGKIVLEEGGDFSEKGLAAGVREINKAGTGYVYTYFNAQGKKVKFE